MNALNSLLSDEVSSSQLEIIISNQEQQIATLHVILAFIIISLGIYLAFKFGRWIYNLIN